MGMKNSLLAFTCFTFSPGPPAACTFHLPFPSALFDSFIMFGGHVKFFQLLNKDALLAAFL